MASQSHTNIIARCTDSSYFNSARPQYIEVQLVALYAAINKLTMRFQALRSLPRGQGGARLDHAVRQRAVELPTLAGPELLPSGLAELARYALHKAGCTQERMKVRWIVLSY